MRSLRYTASAREDLVEIALYVATESGSREVADAFGRKLEQRCQRLAFLPGTLGTARPELREDLRSTPFRGYVIFFRYGPEMLEIVNVLHASRDTLAYFHEE